MTGQKEFNLRAPRGSGGGVIFINAEPSDSAAVKFFIRQSPNTKTRMYRSLVGSPGPKTRSIYLVP